jgi:hypothetical protein
MPKLTKRYLRGADIGYEAIGSQEAAINKLGRIEARGPELLNRVCDYSCGILLKADADEREGLCRECPVTKLLRIIE